MGQRRPCAQVLGGAGVKVNYSIPMSMMGHEAPIAAAELAASTPRGAIVEVGVFRGGCAYYLAEVARARGDQIHLFDTFSGIPFKDAIDHDPVGAFSCGVDDVRKIIPDAVFHVGIFPGTLPDNLTDIAFVHSDCDQYRSVKAVIDNLWPRIVPGGILAFDDMDTPGGEAAIREAFSAGRLIPSAAGSHRVYVRK